jgi:hypothetical protein
MKYFKHRDGDRIKYFAAESTPNINIPPDPANMDYQQMMQEVDAGTSEIEEVE